MFMFDEVVDTDDGFPTLLEDCLHAVSDNPTIYHVFFGASLVSKLNGNAVDNWLQLAKGVAKASNEANPNPLLNTDRFILSLALLLAVKFNKEYEMHLTAQQ